MTARAALASGNALLTWAIAMTVFLGSFGAIPRCSALSCMPVDRSKYTIWLYDAVPSGVTPLAPGITEVAWEEQMSAESCGALVDHEGAAHSACKAAWTCVLCCAGFSDPVYAEACVTVHQYDIVLDVTVTNRTADTLQNLNLELATMGDLKLVERPQNYALRPHGQQNIR